MSLSSLLYYHDNGQGIPEKQFRFSSLYTNEFALTQCCTSTNLKILPFGTPRKSQCYFSFFCNIRSFPYPQPFVVIVNSGIYRCALTDYTNKFVLLDIFCGGGIFLTKMSSDKLKKFSISYMHLMKKMVQKEKRVVMLVSKNQADLFYLEFTRFSKSIMRLRQHVILQPFHMAKIHYQSNLLYAKLG